ncbi:exodeoxyribonuclease III [Dyadobacter flavalbus]|uniref:Exodeoxyribonuclease III n=1 Tax=Dyadobacter flavalbus TaxID=2579942 RepID=A0A5M8R460_9BACT|nr:exodeoxyribonuclease III [Dyadobacter flavalbus]KAA6441593.1 exodeoxyribonuclease III [Dyadobacter flavalbus]
MQILTYNLNGIRAALKNGLIDWLRTMPADILCFQEVKATPDVVDLAGFAELGYELIGWHAAEKKGYSGVAIFSKIVPDYVFHGCSIPVYDQEGRILRADFGDITILNCYFPSGTSGEIRQGVKMEFLRDFYEWVYELRKERPNLIICGDYNIAHTEIDIHDPVRNKKMSGFLPEEREWLTKWFDNGYTDAFRFKNPDRREYSWWTYRAGARANNKGWRIDYISVADTIKDRIVASRLYNDAVHSDHCPVWLELD